MNLKEKFDKFNDDFLKFEAIKAKLSLRPDLHAFLLLDSIVPPVTRPNGMFSDMVTAAEHDEIWLATPVDELEKVATEEQIRDLVRCGVRYDDQNESLCMYA